MKPFVLTFAMCLVSVLGYGLLDSAASATIEVPVTADVVVPEVAPEVIPEVPAPILPVAFRGGGCANGQCPVPTVKPVIVPKAPPASVGVDQAASGEESGGRRHIVRKAVGGVLRIGKALCGHDRRVARRANRHGG